MAAAGAAVGAVLAGCLPMPWATAAVAGVAGAVAFWAGTLGRRLQQTGQACRRLVARSQRANHRAQGWFGLSMVGFVELTADGRVRRCNDELATILCRRAGDLRGARFTDLVVEGEQGALQRELQSLTAAGADRMTCVVALRRDDGSQVSCSLSARPLVDAGRVVGVAMAAVDMTEIYQVLARLREARDEAAAAARAKSDFLAAVSHELRTPLAAILGAVDGCAEVSAGSAAPAAIIRRQAEHLLGLVTNLLEYVSLDINHSPVELAPCNPVRIVGEVVEHLTPRAEAKVLSLRLQSTTPVPWLGTTDAARFRQVLFQVIDNAVKFTAFGMVRVVVACRDGGVAGGLLQVSVQDTGVGIDPARLDVIRQGLSAGAQGMSRSSGGLGLGLPLADRLARLLGGTLRLRSAPGEGTEVVVEVPLGDLRGVPFADSIDEMLARERSVVEVVQASLPAASQPARILVAEDGPDNQRLIRAVQQRAGHLVEVVDDGQQALDTLAAAATAGQPFDVVVMDMQMPRLDGYAATTALRQRGATLPVIALTAHALPEDRQRCLDAGCSEYATKPLDRRDLLCKIEQALAHREPVGGLRA